jgi:hypothetical protein
MTLTEKDAAIAFAKAWNRLDCTDFLPLLADDATYESQWVLSKLEGREAIATYLTKKMQVVKASGSKVRAELVQARCDYEFGRDCVLLVQNEEKDTQAVVVFRVEKGQIKRYDLCAPEFFDPEQTGIYPI